MTHVLVAGETLIDFLPETAGPLSTVEQFSRRPGGAPANVAVGLSRLGVDVDFWTRIGTDPFGDFLAETLRAESIPETYVERDPDAKTALAFVSLGEDAEREFSFHRNRTADTRLDPGRVVDGDLDRVDWVHLGGVALADEPSRTATYDLAARAGERGATVSFDPNARPELWTDFDFADSMRRAFSLVDVVKATPEDLAAAGYDGDPTDLAAAVCEEGPHTALVTLGGDGALAHATADAPWVDGDDPMTVTHGGYDIDPVDTTGAGDAFTAGAISALGANDGPDDALAIANAVAALTTTAQGAMTALPTRSKLDAFRSE
ncbi:carbohydrate kinase family protein [Haloferacaceae archaeon DSL9]